MSGRSMRQRAPVSYKANDMNQAKTPSWLVRPRRRAPRCTDGSSARARCAFSSWRSRIRTCFPSTRPSRPPDARALTVPHSDPPLARQIPSPVVTPRRSRRASTRRCPRARRKRRSRRTPSLPRSSRRSSRTSRAATTTSRTIPRRSTEAARRARRTARRARPRARARRRRPRTRRDPKRRKSPAHASSQPWRAPRRRLTTG